MFVKNYVLNPHLSQRVKPFINYTCLCHIFTYIPFKRYCKIVQLKQILSELKYFQNGLPLLQQMRGLLYVREFTRKS